MILKNLSLFIKNNKMLFTLLVVTQIAAVSIILFSYGIYRNNQYKLAEKESADLDFSVSCVTNEEGSRVVLFSEVKDKLPEIVDKYKDLISNVFIMGYGHIEDEDKEALLLSCESELYKEGMVMIQSAFSPADSGFDYSSYNQNVLDRLQGRDFTKEELNGSDRVCLVSVRAHLVHPDYWTVDGVEYEVIGNEVYSPGDVISIINSNWMEFMMPYYAMPDGMQFKTLSFELVRPLLRSEYDDMLADFMSFMDGGSTRYSEFYGVEIDEKATMRTMMFTSVFMSLISAFSVCLIYRYMLTKRIRTTAVYRICGCSAARSAMVYIGEMIIVLAGSCVAGSLIFEWLVEPKLQKNYQWFAVIYGSNSCYLLVLMYFAIVAFFTTVMIALSCRKTPKEMLRSKVN